MLHSMTIRLIHVHQLETLYLLNEVKCQPGIIWGHRGQKVIFSKMLLLLQNTWCYLYVTQWLSSDLLSKIQNLIRKILRNRFQFIVTTRVYIFGKCLCLAFSSLRKIWTPDLLRITKNQSDVTNFRWYNFL